jgi:hypothetical protein
VKSLVILAVLAGAAVAAPRKKEPPKKEPPVAKAPEPAPPPAPPPPPQPPPPTSSQRIVGVLDVRVDGVPPEIAAQFQQQLEAQVDPKHFWLAPRSRMHEMMTNSTKWTEGCVVGACLGEVKRQTNADLVLLVALNGSGTSFGYVVTLVRTDTGTVLAQESERCDVCTVSEALTKATLATVKILDAAPDQLPDDKAAEIEKTQALMAKFDSRQRHLEHHPKAVATGILLTGLAVAAGGAGLYYANHNAGIATAAVGGGLALGGIFALTF